MAEEFIDAETNIEIEAEVEIVFPYNVYFEGVYLSYRFGPNENWSQILMEQDGDSFTALLEGKPAEPLWNTTCTFRMYLEEGELHQLLLTTITTQTFHFTFFFF